METPMSAVEDGTQAIAKLLHQAGVPRHHSGPMAHRLYRVMALAEQDIASRGDLKALQTQLSDAQEDFRRDVDHALASISGSMAGVGRIAAQRQEHVLRRLKWAIWLLLGACALLLLAIGFLAWDRLEGPRAPTMDTVSAAGMENA